MKKNYQLLIIDDDDFAIKFYKRSLEECHFQGEITEIASAHCALDLLKESSFSCVLLDYNLPGMSSLDFLTKVKEFGIDVPIIFITGQGNKSVDLKALELGAADYLQKDQVNGPILERAIRFTVERAQHLTQLKEINRHLEESNSAKEDFLAAMSHELRTPLNAVISFSECLRSGIYGDLTGKQKDITQKISRAGQHLSQIVEEIFNISELSQPGSNLNLETFNIIESLKFTLNICEDKALAKNIPIHINYPSKELSFKGDKSKIQQLFINLITNAIKFTDEGSVSVELIPTSTALEFYVRDTGIGIEKAKLSEVLKPFSQADSSISREFGGIGLGLSISKKIVEGHNGEISLTSEEGKGTQVKVILPRAEFGH